MRTVLSAWLVSVALLAAPAAWGADLFVDAFKYSDPMYETSIQVQFGVAPGVTGVSAKAADGTMVALNLVAPGDYYAKLGPFATFAAFHATTVGNWQLMIDASGASLNYDFTVNEYRTPFTDASFAPAPTMTSPTDGAVGVPATPTFQWDNGGPHTGALESLYTYVQSDLPPVVSQAANPPLGATSWTPAISLPSGAASFLVQYETNENEDANVTDPVYNSSTSTGPDPGIAWDTTSGDLFSRDLIHFTVVPEPATMALLAAGFLPLLARRRKP
jgi:hypothetical protein